MRRRGRLHIDDVATDADAHVVVRALDVSRADAASTVLAERDLGMQRLVAGQRCTIEFTLDVDPPPRARCSITAHVDVSGSGDVTVGDYVTTQHIPLVGAAEVVDVPLRRVG